MCPCDIWTMENVTHGKMNSRVRETSSHLKEIKKIRWVRGETRKKGKGKKKKRKRKGRNEGKRGKKKKGRAMRGEEEKEKEKKMNDTSFRNLWLTSGRNSSRQETKLVHVMRAMHGF